MIVVPAVQQYSRDVWCLVHVLDRHKQLPFAEKPGERCAHRAAVEGVHLRPGKPHRQRALAIPKPQRLEVLAPRIQLFDD